MLRRKLSSNMIPTSTTTTLSPVRQALAAHLRALRLCGRCVLRHLGVRGDIHRSASDDAAGPTCPACLGMLQQQQRSVVSDESSLVARLRNELDAVRRGGASSFVVSVRVPLALAVRDRAVQLEARRLLRERDGIEWVLPPAAANGGTLHRRKKTKKKGDDEESLKRKVDEMEDADGVADGEGVATDAITAETTDFKIVEDDKTCVTTETVTVKEVIKNLLVDVVESADVNAALPSNENADAPPPPLRFDATGGALSIDFEFVHQETENEQWRLLEKFKDKCNFNMKKRRIGGRGNKNNDRSNTNKVIYEGGSWEKIVECASKLDHDDFVSAGAIPPEPPSRPAVVGSLKAVHASLFIAGRYNKYRRGVSHTHWEVGGRLLAEHSVEEIIAPHIKALFEARDLKFASAGREDADVLMLGDGRPFYIEICAPRKVTRTARAIAAMQEAINTGCDGMIRVTDLQIVGRNDLAPLKDSAATKKKSYRTVVRFSRPVPLSVLAEISKMTDFELKQQTPVRVMARRTDIVRDKIIHKISISPADDAAIETDRAVVDLTTSAGTYVKEFVHGDGGRTVPCLAGLCGEDVTAAVESLDVLSVELDWPPKLGPVK